MGSKSDKIDQLKTTMSRITSDFGTKQSNTDNWLRVNRKDQTGPMLLEDTFSREKIHRFDHERIPERVVHARGAGAFGTFRLHESAEDVTHAGILTDTSRETPLFVRFSTVLGSRGSADTVRDVRGFAVKFYTPEGNWDIVGNNIPVFFIQDAIKFPDLIHAGKPEPHNEVPQGQSAHNNFWDFVYMHSEATHMYFWTMSDRAIPRSFRMMQGFGVNTYTLINAKGEKHFVKFHFTPELGVHSLVWDEALKLAGQDPDFHRKDLWEAIENGAYPKWKFGIQTIPESKEHDFDFDVLDATKVWPEDLIPVRYIGELELNRNVDEYFTQTEQVAFCTSHVIPGIGFSDDPLLQGRNFSYSDTQLSRLGINWQELPINRPVCPVMNFNRDGAMRHTIAKGKVNYWPNRYGYQPAATKEEGGYIDYPQKVQGIKERALSAKFKDHTSQAQLFLQFTLRARKSTSSSSFFVRIDGVLAETVADMVGGKKPQGGKPNPGTTSKNLSQMDFLPETPTIATRRVGIIIADGYDPIAFNAVYGAIKAQKRHPSYSSKGIIPDHHLEGQRSTMFDALFIPGGERSIQTLAKIGRARYYIREAFGHLKAIGGTGEGVQLIENAIQLPEVSLSEADNGNVVESYGVVTLRNARPESLKEIVSVAKNAKGFLEQFVYAISQHRCWQRELDGLNVMVAY
ncbi:Catalase-1 [Fusarium oligoseptatum]|uniref:Catalase n=1 Tax=Fusarium oligoseptatum TaxID=2604345 RepID=A0A428UFP9_9HYPO|nr:Catalase-1 [Fusarium oligoseptatum]